MKPRRITIHCSANSNGSLTTGEDIRRYHMAMPPKGRGWTDIGYHMVVETCGGLFRGRADDHMGAHVEDHNDGNLGICLIGNNKFTRAQFAGLRFALDRWFASYDIMPSDLYCHYQWGTAKKQGKTCPNIPIDVIKDWYFGQNEDAIVPYLLGD